MRDHFAAQPERRAQHDVHHAVVVLVGRLIDRLGAADTGVVDQEIDPPEPFERQRDDPGGRILGGDIDGNGGDHPGIADFLLQRRQLARIAPHADDGGARGMEQLRGFQPDAATRAGDDRYFHEMPWPLVSVSRIPSLIA